MDFVIAKRRLRKHSGTAYGCGKALLKSARENRAMVILSLILLSGMVLGAIYAKSAGYSALEHLDFIFAGNFKARATQSFVSVFSASFASSFLFIFACFLCGLSMWGAFFIPLILLFRGFGLGLTSGYLYAVYGWKGILYNLTVLLPGAFICCLSILFASLEGIRFSHSIAFGNTDSSGKINLRFYWMRFGIILLGACIAAAVDLMLSACFGGLYSF